MEKPILFSTSMVKAILDGKKTQTRRVIKLVKGLEFGGYIFVAGSKKDIGKAHFADSFPVCSNSVSVKKPCEIGDILWVRETWNTNPVYEYLDKTAPKFVYKATDEDFTGGWKPSIFMPKKAARLFLKVKEIGVEKLCDITEEAATAEGIRGWTKDDNLFKYGHIEPGEDGALQWRDMPRSPISAFRNLWDSINEKRGYGWANNPWVWVIEFEKQD